MSNPTIPYQDLGNFIEARVQEDATASTNTITNVANTLMSYLNGMIINDQSQPPVFPSTQPVTVNPTTNQLDVSVEYEMGYGLFPKGYFTLYLNGPTGYPNLAMDFRVEFFDYSRVTLYADNLTPNFIIKANLDVTNFSRKALNAFCYGVLGVAVQQWADALSYQVYNGVLPPKI
jgi:hypothetical protein